MKVKMNKLLCTVMFFLCVAFGYAQQITVKGTVKDGSGQPLMGASVLVKGTSHGTAADFDGNFELKVDKGVTLVVSSVGYKSREVAAKAGTMNIVLQEDTQQLEDVVVIGYGAIKKKDLTGSVNLVTDKDFNKAPAVNADQLIQGKIAGVQMASTGGAPGEGQVIRIRGNGSLSLTSNPLIVIDGVPMNDGGVGGSRSIFNSINPEDIESMTVLKDASSTAIYGSRAANGVIMITTKKGKANQDLKISFNTSIALQDVNKYVDVMNANQFRQTVKGLNNPAAEALLGNADTNWQKEIYQTAPMSNSTLVLSGAYKTLPYRVSVGHSYADGILRTNAKISLNPTFFDKSLKLELNANGTYMQNRFANKDAIGAAVEYDPTQSVFGGLAKYGGYHAWVNPNNGSRYDLAPNNPMAMLKFLDDSSKVYRFIGNAKVDYTLPFFKDITASVNVGIDYSKGEGDKITDRRMPTSTPGFDGAKTTYTNKATNKLFDAYINYMKDIKETHNIGLMVGHSYQSFEFDNNSTDYSYFTNPGDNKIVPNIDKSRNVLMSFFGRANYSYKNRYLFTATLRADASSKLNPDDRWGYFPSVALAWNVSNENFLKDNKTLNELKLRFGYGEVGNVNGLGDYLFLTNYTRSQDGASYQLGDAFYQTYRPGVTNKNLRWEIGNTLNAGIDFGFLDNLITGTLDVYRKQTKDLIAETTIDPFTNFKNRVNANVGDMENKGIELGLTVTPIRNIEKNIRWSFNYNISYNENKITKMPDDQPAGGISGGTGNRVQLHREGETPYSFFVYQQVYDAQGNPVENAFVDRNGNGKIDEGDRYLYKSPFAPVTMGFGTDLNYKNWDLNITTRANIGNYVYNNTQSRLDQFGEITANSGFLRNIKANSNFQRHNDQSWLSDYYLENASFFKLDNITLGYTFPHTDKMYIRLYGTVQNVLTITKYSGLDPEALSVDSATNRATFGIDNNLYPRPQTYLLGLNVNF
ncbi:TonB-linked outer membrane protein, SusC/RagA family [Capnocytophaga ochracea F0287]|uniref:TonB-linked outer membrane protein, SusC/RagA family n=1 Tax=Capnocytophaga ochracea F0287 TaxID=873517 RepID=E4MT84_CAPOC|nr:TonB-dependent receptor [Capnocytophaga ochracea]EFS97104.1 TonB-linked outer membrane protein, SusC/RagA family [Capnocytophaga ochracea F0287]UEB42361.1 TonB-dependent receptor [Capnocytophaga ochracea]